jgi:hypothetical protein
MIRSRILGVDAAHRREAEDLIRTTYTDQYGARIDAFPQRLIALLDENGSVLCAAGLRGASEGFFSERYLDAPVEQVLAGPAGLSVPRQEIFEVSTLVSRCPTASSAFIRAIVAHGRDTGFAWSFFTLTRRLRILVTRMGLPVVTLAPADPARIPDAQAWGTYYASAPSVCAVPDSAARLIASGKGGARAAAA